MFKNNLNTFESSIIEYINNIMDKNVAIPAFQREFKWNSKPKKIIDVLDSINRAFNLGTIVFWESGNKGIIRRRDNLNYKKDSFNILYIVDGQQRSLTLAALFARTKYIDVDVDPANYFIIYDAKNNELEFNNTKPKNALFISIEKFKSEFLYGAGNYDFRDDFFDILSRDPDSVKMFIKALKSFRTKLQAEPLIIGYKLSIHSNKLEDAILLFEKINTAGIKLKEFDILDALAYANNEYKLYDEAKSFVQSKFAGILDSKHGFSTDSTKIIINSYKLIKNYIDSGDKKILSMSAQAISNFKKGDSIILKQIINWYKDFIAEIKAIGIKSLKDIPYTLNAVKYIFIRFWEDNQDKKFVKNYQEFLISTMIQTGIGRIYEKSSSAVLVNILKNTIAQLLEDRPIIFDKTLNIKARDILNTSYKKITSYEKAIFIYWISQLKPRDYETGNEVKMDGIFRKAKNLDHIFPKSRYKNIPNVHSLANIALVTEKTNKEKSDKNPSEFFASKPYERHSDIYESLQISSDAFEGLLENIHSTFLSKRASTIASELKNYFEGLKINR